MTSNCVMCQNEPFEVRQPLSTFIIPELKVQCILFGILSHWSLDHNPIFRCLSAILFFVDSLLIKALLIVQRVRFGDPFLGELIVFHLLTKHSGQRSSAGAPQPFRL